MKRFGLACYSETFSYALTLAADRRCGVEIQTFTEPAVLAGDWKSVMAEYRNRFEAMPQPTKVLDVGTGSGILAIAAAVLGAPEIIGCEIDVEACRVARENVELNRVAGQVEITDQPLETINGTFDLIIANIMAEENVRLAAPLVERLSDQGCLILSGILKEKEEFVRKGFKPCGLGDPVVRYENEWCCIIYKRGNADV